MTDIRSITVMIFNKKTRKYELETFCGDLDDIYFGMLNYVFEDKKAFYIPYEIDAWFVQLAMDEWNRGDWKTRIGEIKHNIKYVYKKGYEGKKRVK